jgi:HEAT repeat protein
MLADAFESLKKYDWGTDLATLSPIEDATVAAHDSDEVRHDLEKRLIAALQGHLSRDAHDYVCRKLAMVGSAAAVPALAAQLANKATSHMARYALERIPAPEAGAALLQALGTVNGNLKIGVISSLAARGEVAAVVPLDRLLRSDDRALALAAALAVGAIGSVQSVSVLQSALRTGTGDQKAVIDALLHCAESLLAQNRQLDAMSVYNSLAEDGRDRLVRLAATRGLLVCAAKRA